MIGSHRCSDPRCSGLDYAAVYRRIERYGYAILVVFENPLTVYTAGLYASYNLPELVMWFEKGFEDHEQATGILTLVIERLLAESGAGAIGTPPPKKLAPLRAAEPLRISAGRAMEFGGDGGMTLHLWPEQYLSVRPLRPIMTATAAYYREVHGLSLDSVPVWLVSFRPFTKASENEGK